MTGLTAQWMVISTVSTLHLTGHGPVNQWKIQALEKLFRALVLSILPYKCKSWNTWTLTAEMEKRVQAFKTKCFHRLLQISWTKHRTNE